MEHEDVEMEEASVSHTREKGRVSFSSEQAQAIDTCCDLSEPIVGVTGGAGTGKTLVLGEVYRELKKRIAGVVLCAPTGRAAKRIQELSGIPAKTVHRLLEFPTPLDDEAAGQVMNEPRRNRQNRLTERVIIVDEASMVSPTLYRQLMDALPNNGVIRFFGDNNQLPPVEDGIPPFIDVLKRFPSVTLSFNFRSEDAIVSNAMRILEAKIPLRNNRFEILYTDDPIRRLLEFVTTDFVRDDHQIIMPTRNGKYGTIRVNPSLQLRFNKTGPLLRLDRFNEKDAALVVRANDKFLWIKNDYKLEMFNGEIGRIEWIDEEDGSLGLLMQDRAVTVPARVRTFSPYFGTVIQYDPRKQIELGYAITTHKAQGSEFKTVVYCIMRGQAFLLNRRNFYTAVTRAKTNVIVIADRKAMGLSMKKHLGSV